LFDTTTYYYYDGFVGVDTVCFGDITDANLCAKSYDFFIVTNQNNYDANYDGFIGLGPPVPNGSPTII